MGIIFKLLGEYIIKFLFVKNKLVDNIYIININIIIFKMNTEKRKKIEQVVRVIVSRFITEDLPDNENIFGIINISELILSTDWSYLDIKVSSFHHKDVLTKTLAKYAHIIQRNIWKEVWMRVNPRVRFRYDDSWEIWEEITNEINSIDIANMESKFEQ